MDVACGSCRSKFKIPEEKVPRGQLFSVPCPKCKNKISIDTRPREASRPPEPEPQKEKTLADEVASWAYDSAEKPFDFVEEGMQTALLCEPDPVVRGKIKAALDDLGYHTIEPQSALEALKQMRFHVFDIIVLNEKFDSDNPNENPIHDYLNRLVMAIRRNIFVTLITDRFRSSDNMAAFNESVNLVINLKNTDEVDKILKRGIAENESFYRVYKESLARFG
jgi:CheY-like chemotaxis protein